MSSPANENTALLSRAHSTLNQTPRSRSNSLFWRTTTGATRGGGPEGSLDERTVSVLDVITGHRLVSEYIDANAVVEPSESKSSGRSLQWHHLMLIIYFNAIGGPFGLEAAVGAAGPLISLIGVVACAILWCLPQALMSAELSMLCEDEGNGGNFNWVYRAFGPGLCFLNAVNALINATVYNSITLLLIPQYLNAASFTFWDNAALMGGFATLAALFNVTSPSAIGRINLFYTPLMFLPFFVIFIAYWDRGGLDHASGHELLEIPPTAQINFSVYVSVVIWAFGGFDIVGNAAADIAGGRATYMKGLFGALLMGVLTYLVPVVMMYLISPHRTAWHAGYMSQVGFVVSPWCGKLMRATAISACFFSYSASVFPTARLVWAAAVAEPDRQLFPRWFGWSFAYSSGALSPVVAIIITSLAMFGCALGPYVFLVEVYVMFRIVNLIAEYASLFMLRYKEPNTYREFLIPGGYPALIVMVIPVAGVIVVLCTSSKPISLLVGFGIQPLFVCMYYARAWYLGCSSRRDAKSRLGSDTGVNT